MRAYHSLSLSLSLTIFINIFYKSLMYENEPESLRDLFLLNDPYVGVPEVKHPYVKVGAVKKSEVLDCFKVGREDKIL